MGMCREQDSHFAAPGSEVFDANSAGFYSLPVSLRSGVVLYR